MPIPRRAARLVERTPGRFLLSSRAGAVQGDVPMDGMIQLPYLGSALYGIALGGFFVGLIAMILGYRFKRVSLSKRAPAFWLCAVSWSLSIAAGIAWLVLSRGTLNAPSIDRDDNLPVMYGATSALMLGIMLLNPLMHRKSGFRPAELRIKLVKMGTQQERIEEEIRQFFEAKGFDLHDGSRLGYTFVAVPSLKSMGFSNPHAGQVRAFVKIERSAWDVDFSMLVDTKEYILSITWETEATRAVAMATEQFLREKYGEGAVPA